MFSFYGSKKSKAYLYPNPKNNLIIEPFAGAAGYSTLHRKKEVHLYDVDIRIITVWKYLIAATKQDIMSLPMFGPGTDIRSFNLSKPEELFLGYMISAATRNPKKTASSKSNWKPSKQRQIADFVMEIKHWQANVCDFRQIKNVKATWFIDPPYVEAGKWYDKKLNLNEYQELANYSQTRLGQVIVCENQGANWLNFKQLYSINGQKNNKRIEVLWTNDEGA